jgi:hypothetical protein
VHIGVVPEVPEVAEAPVLVGVGPAVVVAVVPPRVPVLCRAAGLLGEGVGAVPRVGVGVEGAALVRELLAGGLTTRSEPGEVIAPTR